MAKDREAWRAAVHGGHKESDSAEQLNSTNNKGRPGGRSLLGWGVHAHCGAGESSRELSRGSDATLSSRARVFPLLAPLSHL